MSEQKYKPRANFERYMYHRGFYPTESGKTVIHYNGQLVKGSWVYGYLWMGNNYAVIIPHNCGVDHDPSNNVMRTPAYHVLQDTVSMLTGLFTGLFDHKIWQDDIVKFDDGQTSFIGKVVFCHGAFGIAADRGPMDASLKNWCHNDNYISFHELMENQDCPDVDIVEHLSILGNVWENDIEDFEDDGRDAKFE